MLLQFAFTSLLVNSLYFVSEGSIELNQTTPFFLLLKSVVEFKTELGVIRSDQHEVKESQNRLERMLNIFIDKLKPISDSENKNIKTQLPKDSMPRSCAEAMTTPRRSGIYDISIPFYYEQPFKVACSAETRGGNWTIILQRMDGSENLYRKWAEYKEGFGNLTGEFFLGLDKIYALTNDQPQELLVLLEDFEGEIRYEAYDAFAIGDELDLYKLHTLGKAIGSVGDSFSYHHGMNFSSQDRDNDESSSNCAKSYTSGWWYKACHESNLMGKFKDNTFGKGITWGTWRGYSYSLKRAVMMIRPKTI